MPPSRDTPGGCGCGSAYLYQALASGDSPLWSCAIGSGGRASKGGARGGGELGTRFVSTRQSSWGGWPIKVASLLTARLARWGAATAGGGISLTSSVGFKLRWRCESCARLFCAALPLRLLTALRACSKSRCVLAPKSPAATLFELLSPVVSLQTKLAGQLIAPLAHLWESEPSSRPHAAGVVFTAEA